MMEDGLTVPEPSSLDQIMADITNRDAVAILMDAPVPAVSSVRVNITLPDDLLARIDRHAAARGSPRSGFLACAARKQMAP
jgi:HicB_like antitoxin of bacterial toxin-antitoxin system